MNELKKQRTEYLPSVETPKFDDYLNAIGLPTDNILADTDERGIVIENIPQIIKDIPSDRKEKKRLYIYQNLLRQVQLDCLTHL